MDGEGFIACTLSLYHYRIATLSLDNLRTVAGLASKGLIKPGMLITHTVPFSRYDEALELVESGEAVKVALIWE